MNTPFASLPLMQVIVLRSEQKAESKVHLHYVAIMCKFACVCVCVHLEVYAVVYTQMTR
jgi:hypothetical protein